MYLDINQIEGIKPVEFEARLLETKDDVRKWVLISNVDGSQIQVVFHERAYVLQKVEDIPEVIVTDQVAIEAWINDFLKEELERAQSGFDGSDDNEYEEPQPYDPHKINIRNQNWSISHMFELIDKWKQVDLAPDFQRGFIWDYARKSQLIESLMLRIPVPAFYLSETLEGNYQVVDGLQRLSTIRDFMRNEFSLKHLEYLSDQEGKYFEEGKKRKGIDQMYWRNILQTQITVNIIGADSPTKVKYDVFRRINTGGKPLNNQEIRNCLSEAASRRLVNELAFSKEFHGATGRSVSTTRMQAQELVLRFIGFWHDRIKKMKEWEYRGNMTEYLDVAVELLNNNKSAKHPEIKEAFFRGMENAHYLFGQYSFRKCLPDHFKPNARQQLINKSLFSTWSVLLSAVPRDLVEKTIEAGSFASVLAQKLEEDQAYLNVVSYKTNDRSYVDLAFSKAEELIDKYFNR